MNEETSDWESSRFFFFFLNQICLGASSKFPFDWYVHQSDSNWCKQVIWRLQDLFFYNSDYWLLMIVLIFRCLKPWQLQYSCDLLHRLRDSFLLIPEDRGCVLTELCPVPRGCMCVCEYICLLILIITAARGSGIHKEYCVMQSAYNFVGFKMHTFSRPMPNSTAHQDY